MGQDRQPVVVVSVDGVAPRHITRTTMPALTTLARGGASCFTARTIEPPITLPVHTTMLRGVLPEVHGVYTNDDDPRSVEAPSFLKVARASGLSTASCVNWLPIDGLIEPDAASERFVIDGGYDLDEDRRSVSAAMSVVGDHELVFVYLAHPDVVGHECGWDSGEYLEAVRRTDRLLADLIGAAGPEASLLVTTDHGGLGTGHFESSPEVLETFVIVRASGRVAPASGWATASPLDVAPTVADLCGLEPSPQWQGASLIGREVPLVDVVLDLVASMAEHRYGERVTMLEHALQAAALAQRADLGDELTLAALLHDLGHLLGAAGDWGLPGHAEVGARALQHLLDPAIVEPIRLHVDAKRYRVAVDPDYAQRLSLASQMSLAEQGGPLTGEAVEAFGAQAFAAEALQLRELDDAGKVDDGDLADQAAAVEGYRRLLVSALEAVEPLDPAWVRHRCECAECRDASSGQRLVGAEALDGWRVVRSDVSGPMQRVVLHHRDGRRHECVLPAGRASDPEHRPWHAEAPPALFADDLDSFVAALSTDGIAVLTDVPTEPGEVLRMARRVGFVRETNYGELFDVVAEPDPVNLAYTSLGLSPHTDNPYRDPRPTVQLLHCLEASSAGGASLFTDGLAVADHLRDHHRLDFDVLTTTEVEFRFAGDGVDLRARRPLIELDTTGEIRSISLNDRSMEPPQLPSAALARFYDAYRRWCALVGDPRFVIEHVLRPGELVGFDNRRVLHGRRGFEPTTRRHLQGCYIDIDAVRSAARLVAG